MADIKTTRIATSYPLDICQGIALLPGIGTVRAGRTFSNSGRPIVGIPKTTILLWRFSGSVKYELLAGVCGPAYALSFDLAGATSGRNVSLKVTNDEAAAGLFAGLVATFPIEFAIDSGSVTWSWSHGFGVKWHQSLSKRVAPQVDILDLIIKIVQKLMQDRKKSSDVKKGEKIEGKTEESKKDPKKDDPKVVSVPTWGMYDRVAGQLSAGKGKIVPEPTFTITVDLVPLFGPLKAVDTALKALWGNFSLGPKLKLINPVEITINRVYLDQQEVKQLKMQGAQLSGQTDTEVPAPANLRVDVNHAPAFTLGASFYLSISVCKLFSYDPETATVRLDELLGVKVTAGPYCSSLANAVGSLTGAAQEPGTCKPAKVAVLLEP